MWGELIGGFKFLISLARDAQRDRGEREKLRQQLDELTRVVQWLWDQEMERTRAEEQRQRDDANEREKLLLRLKIQLLEFERRLSPPPPGAPPPSSLAQG